MKIIFRKLRLQSYRNTKRSEQKMLNNFKRIFGNEKEVVVCFGDYEQMQKFKNCSHNCCVNCYSQLQTTGGYKCCVICRESEKPKNYIRFRGVEENIET